jgi:hypothetical protein
MVSASTAVPCSGTQRPVAGQVHQARRAYLAPPPLPSAAASGTRRSPRDQPGPSSNLVSKERGKLRKIFIFTISSKFKKCRTDSQNLPEADLQLMRAKSFRTTVPNGGEIHTPNEIDGEDCTTWYKEQKQHPMARTNVTLASVSVLVQWYRNEAKYGVRSADLWLL